MHALALDDLGGTIIYVNATEFRSRCRVTHAYAITIDKFHGSEEKVVVYGLST